MTAADWLARRDPAPPPSLHEHLCALVAARAEPDVPTALMESALEALSGLLATGDTSRRTATDLLAIDALVTYAFEAAASDPASLPDRARAAEVAIARLLDAGRP